MMSENRIIQLNASTLSVENVKTGKTVKVSHTIFLLFTILSKHKNNMVTKKDIFDGVLKEARISQTNNALNHYITLLRKILVSLDMEETLIVSTPKIGYSLQTIYSFEVIESRSPEKHEVSKKAGFSQWHYGVHISLIIIALIIIGAIYFLIKMCIRAQPIHYMFSVNKCNVYSSSKRTRDKLMENFFIRDAKTVSLNCKLPRVIIYDTTEIYSNKVTASDEIRSMIICTENNYLEKVNVCVSHYFKGRVE